MTDKLRQDAEERVQAHEAKRGCALSPEETQHVLHELRVHQIELEMQNEELRHAQAALDTARAHYFDLYDLAPIGYITLTEMGVIQEANFTAATLLGVARAELVKQPLSRFIHPDFQDQYYRHRHRKQFLDSGASQACELRMVQKDGTQFWANLSATATQDSDGVTFCRVMINDITERRQAEEKLLTGEAHLRIISDNTYDWE